MLQRALLTQCLALSLCATAATPRLAVMEIHDRSGNLSAKLTSDLTQYLRAELGATGRFVVIDKSRQVTEQKRLSFQACNDDACQIPLGKALSADTILRTTVTRIGSVLQVSAELIDLAKEASAGGATSKCASDPKKGLEDRVRVAVDSLVAQLTGAPAPHEVEPPPPPHGTGPHVEGGRVTPATGHLIVQGSPKGARVDVAGPKGFKTAGALPLERRDLAPGRYEVTVSAAEYEAETRTVSVPVDAATVETFALARPGELEVKGTPEGAEVRIDGPNGFSVTRGLPVTVHAAPRGEYRIHVSRAGYLASDATATVAAGTRVVVPVALEKEAAAASGMVLVKPGTFTMGSPSSEEGRDDDEGPQHTVRITRSFWLGATEVTQGEYTALMGKNPSKFTACGDKCPVEQVSWDEAVAFANARSRKEGLPECYSGSTFKGLSCKGYRLPTEAEWEYAARAGTTGARYGELDDVAWYDGNSGSTTHPVGTKQPNAWGLHDMLGNVWEWTGDGWGAYASGTATDPLGSGDGSLRVLRGGSWGNGARGVRAAYRFRGVPSLRLDNLGFRLARSGP